MKTVILLSYLIAYGVCVIHPTNYLGVSTQHDISNQITSYSFNFWTDFALEIDEVLGLKWPYDIHTSVKQDVKISIEESASGTSVCKDLASLASANEQEYLFLGCQLAANVIYKITVQPTALPPSIGLISKLVDVFTASSPDADRIVYERNSLLYSIYVPPLVDTDTLDIEISFEKNDVKALPGITQNVVVEVTIPEDLEDARLILLIDNPTESPSSFNFVNTCNLMIECEDPLDCGILQTSLYSCVVQQDNTKMVLEFGESLTKNKVIRISATITNPQFISTKQLKGYFQNQQNGLTLSKGTCPTQLMVSALSIQAQGQYFFWGLPSTSTIPQINLAIYRAGPFNNIQLGIDHNGIIGFKSSQPISYFTYPQVLTFYLQSTALIESSVAHNLPSFNAKSVYCFDQSGNLVCKNVGNLIENTVYSVAVKAFYVKTTSSVLNNFGKITIRSYTETLSNLQVYSDIDGVTMTVIENTETLDSGAGGWHEPGTGLLGDTQVVSVVDDLTLSATPNALDNLFTSTRSNVGIIPLTDKPQQLLFFTKIPMAKQCVIDAQGTACTSQQDRYVRMNVLFNTQSIGFSQGHDYGGMDVAGWKQSTGKYLLHSFNCFSQSKCDYFEYASADTKNTLKLTAKTDQSLGFGLVQFDCGVLSPTGNVVAHCDNFNVRTLNLLQGKGTADKSSGVFAIRHVRFQQKYHTSPAVSEMSLDFLVSFSTSQVQADNSLGAFQFASASLINSYSLNYPAPPNLFAGFVNLYSKSGQTNTGFSVPSMLLLQGNIPEESQWMRDVGQNKYILAFFDQYMDASNFVEEDRTLGCTSESGLCEFFNNAAGVSRPQDNYLLSPTIKIQLPNDVTESQSYQLLTPVAFNAISDNRPRRLVIALASNTIVDTILGPLTGTKVHKAYRYAGMPVYASLQSLPIFRSLAQSGQTSFGTYAMSSQWAENVNYLSSLSLLTQNIPLDPLNNQFYVSFNRITQSKIDQASVGQGSGFTIVSLGLPIMQQASYTDPPVENTKQCIYFTYSFTCNSLPLCPTYTDKLRRYLNFCPTDSSAFSIYSRSNMITFNNIVPLSLPYQMKMTNYLTYVYSGTNGQLMSYNADDQIITNAANVYSCQTSTSSTLYSTSPGLQQLVIELLWEQTLLLDELGVKGSPSFKVKVDLAAAITGFTFDVTKCSIDQPFSCQLQVSASQTLLASVSIAGDVGINSLTLIVYGTATAAITPTESIAFNVLLTLPDTRDLLYFPSIYTTPIQFAKCSSQTPILISAFKMTSLAGLEDFQFSHPIIQTKSDLQMTFGPSQPQGSLDFPRATLLSKYDTWEIDLSILYQQNSLRLGEINCQVYQRKRSEEKWILSRNWKELKLYSDTDTQIVATLTAKYDLWFPQLNEYQLYCRNIITPSSQLTSSPVSPEFTWLYSGGTIQESAVFNEFQALATTLTPATLPSLTQLFNKDGFSQFISISFFTYDLSEYSLINIRIKDSDISQTQCIWTEPPNDMEFPATVIGDEVQVGIPPRGLQLSLTLAGVGLSGAVNSIQVLLTPKPKSTAQVQLFNLPIQSSSTTPQPLLVYDIYYSSTYFLVPFDMYIVIQLPSMSTSGVASQALFIDIPKYFGRSIGQSITCTLQLYTKGDLEIKEAAGSTIITNKSSNTNQAKSCKFLSATRIQINLPGTLSETTADYLLVFKGLAGAIPSMYSLPIKPTIFLTNPSKNTINYVSFNDRSTEKSWTTSPDDLGLVWMVQDSSGSEPRELGDEALQVSEGFYSKLLILRKRSGLLFDQFIEILVPEDFQSRFIYNSKYNAKITIQIDDQSLNLYIAAKIIANPEILTVQFQSSTTQIPPLKIQLVYESTCSVVAEKDVYLLPINGSTLPIIFDFSHCVPVSSLTITADSGTLVLNKELSQVKIQPTYSDLRFYLVLTDNGKSGQDKTLSPKFTLKGAGAKSFAIQQSPKVITVDDSAGTYPLKPNVRFVGQRDNPSRGGSVIVSIRCDQPVVLYWSTRLSIGEQADHDPMLAEEYLSKAYPERVETDYLGVKQELLMLRSTLQTQFGSATYFTSGTQDITINNLYPTRTYKLTLYVKNQKGLVSLPVSTTIQAKSNGGQYLKLLIIFETLLKSSHIQEILCNLGTMIQVDQSRVYSDFGSLCSKAAFLQGPGLINPLKYSGDEGDYVPYLPKQANGYLYQFYLYPDANALVDIMVDKIKMKSTSKDFNTKIVPTAVFSQFVGITMQNPNINQLPGISLDGYTSNLHAINITVTTSDVYGYLLVGLFEGNKDVIETIDLQQIRLGELSQLKGIKSWQIYNQYTAPNIPKRFKFRGLMADTIYQLLLFTSASDPSPNAPFNKVKTTLVQTLAEPPVEVFLFGRINQMLVFIAFLSLMN